MWIFILYVAFNLKFYGSELQDLFDIWFHHSLWLDLIDLLQNSHLEILVGSFQLAFSLRSMSLLAGTYFHELFFRIFYMKLIFFHWIVIHKNNKYFGSFICFFCSVIMVSLMAICSRSPMFMLTYFLQCNMFCRFSATITQAFSFYSRDVYDCVLFESF